MKSSLNAIFSVSAWSDAMDQAVNTPLVLWANLLRIIFSRSNRAVTDWTQTEDIQISMCAPAQKSITKLLFASIA